MPPFKRSDEPSEPPADCFYSDLNTAAGATIIMEGVPTLKQLVLMEPEYTHEFHRNLGDDGPCAKMALRSLTTQMLQTFGLDNIV